MVDDSMVMRRAVGVLAVLLGACAVTSHPTQKAKLGVSRSSKELLAVIDQPGPLSLKTVVSSDWAIDRSGLINLDHPRARQAGLKDGDEPIQIYFHVLQHPQRGTFIVDTGVENALRDAPDQAVLHGFLASAMHTDKLRIHAPLGAYLAANNLTLAGVLLTHLHADHVMGLPDIARNTPLYVGPGEAQARGFMNVAAQPVTNDFLEGLPPLSELQFRPDPTGRLTGVLDLFGDGSLWVLHAPGHTPGSLAFVARTQQGPVLLTGDTCHTAWGWRHDVEPGSFTGDQSGNARSLAQLRALAREHPNMEVRLGHQLLTVK